MEPKDAVARAFVPGRAVLHTTPAHRSSRRLRPRVPVSPPAVSQRRAPTATPRGEKPPTLRTHNGTSKPPPRPGRTPAGAAERNRVGCRQVRWLCRPPILGRRAREVLPSGSARCHQQATTRMMAVFHGVLGPTTLTEAGSDLHRAYRTRLCCAFRFSQPLDALFRLQPLRPCFMPVTPLGFRFQRVPLPGSGHTSRRDLPFLSFDRPARTSARTIPSRARLQGFAHPESPFTARRCYP
jgi:hypothetical protein